VAGAPARAGGGGGPTPAESTAPGGGAEDSTPCFWMTCLEEIMGNPPYCALEDLKAAGWTAGHDVLSIVVWVMYKDRGCLPPSSPRSALKATTSPG